MLLRTLKRVFFSKFALLNTRFRAKWNFLVNFTYKTQGLELNRVFLTNLAVGNKYRTSLTKGPSVLLCLDQSVLAAVSNGSLSSFERKPLS